MQRSSSQGIRNGLTTSWLRQPPSQSIHTAQTEAGMTEHSCLCSRGQWHTTETGGGKKEKRKEKRKERKREIPQLYATGVSIYIYDCMR